MYLLVTCGGVEEKMYARQVWKECVNKMVIDDKRTTKHFSKNELKELFTLGDPNHSSLRANIAVAKSLVWHIGTAIAGTPAGRAHGVSGVVGH